VPHPLLLLVALAFPVFGYFAARLGRKFAELSHPDISPSFNDRVQWGVVTLFSVVGLGVGIVLATR
jgi:hypothetical protein